MSVALLQVRALPPNSPLKALLLLLLAHCNKQRRTFGITQLCCDVVKHRGYLAEGLLLCALKHDMLQEYGHYAMMFYCNMLHYRIIDYDNYAIA